MKCCNESTSPNFLISADTGRCCDWFQRPRRRMSVQAKIDENNELLNEWSSILDGAGLFF
jgi:hypothetical protein